MQVQPMFDYIFVKQEQDGENTSKGGIFIPETANLGDKPATGSVLAIGSGKLLPNGELRPLEVKIGDKILFVRGTGHKVEMDNQQYTFMKEEDILGILR
jgi:chaperonin GroES